MRWQRLTDEEKTAARQKRLGNWNRTFALLPRWDIGSRTVYWLEYVWRRGTDWGYVGGLPMFGGGEYTYKSWEYRGGREAPELKQPPFRQEKCLCGDACLPPEPVKAPVLFEGVEVSDDIHTRL